MVISTVLFCATCDVFLLCTLTREPAVTVECAEAIRMYHVGIKCATITPDEKRVEGMLMGA